VNEAQEQAAMELSRRVSANFLSTLAEVWAEEGNHVAAQTLGGIVDALRHGNPAVVALLRASVRQAAEDGYG